MGFCLIFLFSRCNITINMFETFMKYYENLDIIINNDENNDQVAVIVEPRNHEYLIPVINK